MSKEAKTNAMRFLEAHKIPYNVRSYDCPEFVDAITTARQNGQPLESSFKTIVTLAGPHKYYVFALPVAEEMDLKKAAKAVSEKSLTLLPVKDLFAITGYVRGGCTVMGMKKQFPTVIHESALNYEKIFISGGRIGTMVEVDPRVLAETIGAKFADILQAPKAPASPAYSQTQV